MTCDMLIHESACGTLFSVNMQRPHRGLCSMRSPTLHAFVCQFYDAYNDCIAQPKGEKRRRKERKGSRDSTVSSRRWEGAGQCRVILCMICTRATRAALVRRSVRAMLCLDLPLPCLALPCLAVLSTLSTTARTLLAQTA